MTKRKDPASVPAAESYQKPVGTYEELIGALVARRRALGLSQLAVDDLAGLPAGYTAKIEISATNPSAKNARSLGKQSLPLLLGALNIRLKVIPEEAIQSPALHTLESLPDKASRGSTAKNILAERGRKGGRNRVARMTGKELSKAMSKAARARWAKYREARKRQSKMKPEPIIVSVSDS